LKTVSINVCNLCVPCENRCRYCLLSWDGKLLGVEYERSRHYAERFYNWIQKNRRDLSFVYYFGYSMEHPNLLDAIDFANQIGSPTGKFLQFDGMKFRDSGEIHKLLTDVKSHGVSLIDLTFYGTQAYHDKFAARHGDFDYLIEILSHANGIGLAVNAGIALNGENVSQIENLIRQLKRYKLNRLRCFVPHGEGRGAHLETIRFSEKDYAALSQEVKEYFNSEKYKTEGQWIRENNFSTPQNRVLTISLTPDNVDLFESMGFSETIAYLESLDDRYYQTIPSIQEISKCYGDPNGERYYSERDLYLFYQRRYIAEHNLSLHDMNDERNCFSRRY